MSLGSSRNSIGMSRETSGSEVQEVRSDRTNRIDECFVFCLLRKIFYAQLIA